MCDRFAELDERFTNYVTIKGGILLLGIFFDFLKGWKWMTESDLLEDVGIKVGFVTAALLSMTAACWSFRLHLTIDDILPVST